MTSFARLRRRAPVAVLVLVAFLSLGCAQGKERAAAAAVPDSTPAAAPSVSTPPVSSPPAPALLDVTMKNARQAGELAAQIPPGTLAERFVHASALFLGVPYQDGPLGEGQVGGVDPDPRVDFDRADCVTYLEQSLALALCAGHDSVVTPNGFLDTLDRIRYRDGQVGFVTRNHYTMRDWVPANAWLVEDVTAQLAPRVAVDAVRTIDRAKFLRDKGAVPRPGVDDAGTITMRVVPRDSLAAVAAAIASGDLIFWAGKKDGIDVVHTGLAVRDAKGTLLFRHASSKAGKVTEEPLADYASRATFTSGFLVLRLREGAR